MNSARRWSSTAAILAVAVSSLFAVTKPAYAVVQVLYAVTGADDENCSGAPSNLYTIDPATAAATLVGPVTVEGTQIAHVVGLAVHPSTGVLYAVKDGDQGDCSDFDQATLMTINPATGVATVIGSAGSLNGRFDDITFDPFGTLYAWNTSSNGSLDQIDITNGTNTSIPSPIGTAYTGLASDSSGRLYVKNGADYVIFRLNQYTADPFPTSIEIDHFSDAMLAFDINDTAYSGALDESGFTLFTINVETGATSTVGSNSVIGISALAFSHGAVTPPAVADLSIDKSVAPEVVALHSDAVFTLELTNDGPGAATNVVVLDVLPDGFTYVSQSGDGSYDSGTGKWTVAAIAASTTASIEITATATAGGAQLNQAEVIAADSYDPDSVAGSGDTTADMYDAVTPFVVTPKLFSIARDESALWLLDEPGFHTVDMKHDIWSTGHEICGGDGLATQPLTNTLFGVVRIGDCVARDLATIDPITGETVLVGGFSGRSVSGIAFADKDTLYAATDSDGASPETLFSVDPTNASLTPVCKLKTGEGHALASIPGYLLHAVDNCDSDCEVLIEVIDLAALPADPADPCSAVFLHTTANFEPIGMTLKPTASGITLRLGDSDARLWYVQIPDTLDSAGVAILTNLYSYPGGLAFDPADITAGNLIASKTAAKMRVKGRKTIVYTVGVSNDGPDAIDNVVVSDILPSGAALLSTSAECQDVGGTITCDAGTIASGGESFFDITVEVMCKKCTSIFNEATVGTGDDIYDYPFDNSSFVSTPLKGKF